MKLKDLLNVPIKKTGIFIFNEKGICLYPFSEQKLSDFSEYSIKKITYNDKQYGLEITVKEPKE